MAAPYCPEDPVAEDAKVGFPEDRTDGQPNPLCSLGPRPIIMTGLMRILLTDHFSDASNIEHKLFRKRLWKKGDDTGILIEDATVWTPGKTGSRPAVIIKRNTWKSQKVSLNNFSGINSEGFDEHIKFWRGSHTLFCIAKEGAEAEILAAEVYRMLMHYAPVFREYFNLMLFELMDVGALGEIEEAHECYGVPITVMYGWSDNWVLRLQTPKLKRIGLSELFPPER